VTSHAQPRAIAILIVLVMSTACGVRAAPLGDDPHPALPAPLERPRVKLGAAVQQALLAAGSEPGYASTFAGEFDSLTPELELKLDHLMPRPGEYDWSAADGLLAFADRHGKDMRGHALVWHRALPPWALARPWSRDELLALLKSHISATVGRYRGRIPEWDVVNEALNDDGSWRPGFWYDAIGPDYVEAAFRFAREADPGARLYYNDYGAERVNAKSDAILALATRLKKAGLLDGVGFQAHFTGSAYATREDLSANLARFAAAGLDLGISELDVAMSGTPGSTAEKLRREAEIYAGVAAACQAQPACKRLTVWGITDRHSWLAPADLPLLFDDAYAAKPAHAAVRAAMAR
jgi:endo-1,4-beta-xylanase